MTEFNIYKDIAERTNGDIYIGVVGPVRTGKSTFIKQFMDKLVMPMLEDKYIKKRTKDELPQSSGGKMIMTTEPKFVPEEAIKLTFDDNASFKVRMIDCVGYSVDGALGYKDEDGIRMVSTPWFNKEIPFQKAAEIGTKKVIAEHSTIGLVVTTDGSFSEIPRENFVDAEKRVIKELDDIGKPYIIALNSIHPENENTIKLSQKLSEKYDVPVIPIDCLHLSNDDIYKILKKVLYEFPIKEIYIDFPSWLESLEKNHWLRNEYEELIKKSINSVNTIRDVNAFLDRLVENENSKEVLLRKVDLGEGLANVEIKLIQKLYFDIIEEVSGFNITNQKELMKLISELSEAKKEYDQVEEALNEVKKTGYGIVRPTLKDMSFDEPELIKKGNQSGVKLKASAPSIHMIRADIHTEVSPVVGTEKQSVELITFLQEDFENNPDSIWETDFLGRSLHNIVQEGISQKLFRMPESAQVKIRDTIEKIVNEGSGGLICIIL
ncbi:MAG: stage IV sporulation protein A [Bacillota bacterium]